MKRPDVYPVGIPQGEKAEGQRICEEIMTERKHHKFDERHTINIQESHELQAG